jgi:hypothetical protein
MEEQQNQPAPQPSVETTPEAAPQPETQSQEPKKKSKWWLWVIVVFVLVIIGVGGWFYYAKGQAMLIAKDMTWDWGIEYENYSMNHNLDLSVTDISSSGSSGLFFVPESIDIKIDGTHVSSNSNIEGNDSIDIVLPDMMDIHADFKYKKLADIIYLSLAATGEVVDQLPDSIQNKWLMVDTNSLGNNDMLPMASFDPDEYDKYVKDFNKKLNNFLQRGKDERWFTVSDPHQGQDSADGKLKKINLQLNPNKIDAFVLGLIETLYPEDMVEEVKNSHADFKASSAANYQNFQDLLITAEISLWANTRTKAIQGFGLNIDNFEFKDEGEHVSNVSLEFSQIISAIEPHEIVAPTEVITMEELMNLLFVGAGTTYENDTLIAQFEIVGSLIDFCFQAGEELIHPNAGSSMMCDNENGVMWPFLPAGYQWSEDFYSNIEDGKYTFCVYSDEVAGVTCSETGCMIEACVESRMECEGIECGAYNILEVDTDNDGLPDFTETELWLTDPNNPDTDGDGYLDGEEVNNGYNPLGDGPLAPLSALSGFASPQAALDEYSLAIADQDATRLEAAFKDGIIRFSSSIATAQSLLITHQEGVTKEFEVTEEPYPLFNLGENLYAIDNCRFLADGNEVNLWQVTVFKLENNNWLLYDLGLMDS